MNHFTVYVILSFPIRNYYYPVLTQVLIHSFIYVLIVFSYVTFNDNITLVIRFIRDLIFWVDG